MRAFLCILISFLPTTGMWVGGSPRDVQPISPRPASPPCCTVILSTLCHSIIAPRHAPHVAPMCLSRPHVQKTHATHALLLSSCIDSTPKYRDDRSFKIGSPRAAAQGASSFPQPLCTLSSHDPNHARREPNAPAVSDPPAPPSDRTPYKASSPRCPSPVYFLALPRLACLAYGYQARKWPETWSCESRTSTPEK